MANQPRVSTCLWFDGDAEEAAGFYTSLTRTKGGVPWIQIGLAGPS